jgi:hypothetical protein
MTQELQQKIKDATNIIELGYKHIQFIQGGCIKKLKNENGYYYAVRNGQGTGANQFTSTILKDAVIETHNYGWDSIHNYK